MTIAIGENTVSSGEASTRALDLGDNPIDIVVTAADASTTRYQIAANRGAGLLQQAYVKASNTDEFDRFGIHVALGKDTLAVSIDRPRPRRRSPR